MCKRKKTQKSHFFSGQSVKDSNYCIEHLKHILSFSVVFVLHMHQFGSLLYMFACFRVSDRG